MSSPWVRTHRLSGFADQAGHCSIMDVLGTHAHNVYVFADPQHTRPLRVMSIRVWNNGQEIPAMRINNASNNGYSFNIPGVGSNHHTRQNISVAMRGGPVYVVVFQNQAFLGRGGGGMGMRGGMMAGRGMGMMRGGMAMRGGMSGGRGMMRGGMRGSGY